MVTPQLKLFFQLAMCLVMIISGCASEVQSQQSSRAAASVHLMSFNIRNGKAKDGDDHWDKRDHRVYQVMGQHRPDIVGLQEAYRFQIDAIREALPEYGEVGVGRDGGTEGEYSSILYRVDRLGVIASGTFWLSDTPGLPSRNWGAGLNRICTWGYFQDKSTGRVFYVFNTHFDHRSQPSRLKSSVLIASHLNARQGPGPAFVMGDLNADESNGAITYLKGESLHEGVGVEHPLVDTFRVVSPKATDVGTFNGFKNQWDTTRKIDYIFVESAALQNKTVSIQSAEILMDRVDGRWPSDHFAVTAKVTLQD